MVLLLLSVLRLLSNTLFVVLLPLHAVRQLWNVAAQVWHIAASFTRFTVSMLHYYTEEQKRIRQVRHAMNHAATYEEFVRHAAELDMLTSQDIWKRDNCGDGLFNAEQIEGYIYHLKELMALNAVDGLGFALHSMASRNIAGIGNEALYRRAAIGTKHLIEEYVDTVHRTLLFVRDFQPHDGRKTSPLHTNLGKYKFFRTLLQCYGRSALMLSGGANMAVCSLGVAKALHDRGLLPKVITGSSGGAIIAGVLATRREEEVASCFQRGTFRMDAFEQADERQQKCTPLRRMMRLLAAGVLLDIERLQQCVAENIGDLTFEEAYRRSGRILNITVQISGHPIPLVLNYITAPSVLVWSAACASCAVPLVFKPVPLLARDPQTGTIRPFHPAGVKFSDGSFLVDLPSTRVAELFNVNFTIVSQTNPHIVPFMDVEGEEDCHSSGDWLDIHGKRDGRTNHKQSREDKDGGLSCNMRRVFRAISFLLSLSSSSMLHRFGRFCKQIVLEELRFRIVQLYRIGLVPRKLAFFEGIVSQKFTGDITVAPMRVSMSSLRSLLTNPTDDYIQHCMREGERKTWRTISIIQNKCRIERTLEECVDYMKACVLDDLRRQGLSNRDDDLLNDTILSVLTEPTRFPDVSGFESCTGSQTSTASSVTADADNLSETALLSLTNTSPESEQGSVGSARAPTSFNTAAAADQHAVGNRHTVLSSSEEREGIDGEE